MEITPEIKNRLEKLQEKYASMGQDMASYLDGLLYADFLTYWDYIHLDTLLSLQNPKTPFPDEVWNELENNKAQRSQEKT